MYTFKNVSRFQKGKKDMFLFVCLFVILASGNHDGTNRLLYEETEVEFLT